MIFIQRLSHEIIVFIAEKFWDSESTRKSQYNLKLFYLEKFRTETELVPNMYMAHNSAWTFAETEQNWYMFIPMESADDQATYVTKLQCQVKCGKRIMLCLQICERTLLYVDLCVVQNCEKVRPQRSQNFAWTIIKRVNVDETGGGTRNQPCKTTTIQHYITCSMKTFLSAVPHQSLHITSYLT